MKLNKYFQAEKFLESLLNLPIRDYLLDRHERSFYVDRLRWFLKLLGEPEKSFKVIHIAGTAGKGTTTNLIHEMLYSAGHSVGSFYSPHPTTSVERIKVGSRLISGDDFSRFVDRLKPKLLEAQINSPYGHPSYFEVFLALAFLYFQEKKCRYVVLEAGLGGTHDATSVIHRPVVSAITNVNYDHMQILGKTLEKIALDKAGVIKRGSIFFTTEARKRLLDIFAKRCEKLKVRMVKVGGGNQELAVTIARQLKIKEKDIKAGIRKAKLPCRFEIMQTKPLVIIDGSHNPSKMKYLADKLKEVKYRQLNLIIGIAKDKDVKNTLKEIIPLADKVILTRFLMPYRKTADLADMQKISKDLKKVKLQSFLDPWQALACGLKETKPADCLVITGSFFLAGELRTHWVAKEEIVKKRRG